MTDESIAFMGAAKASAEAKANEIVEAVEKAFAPSTDITHVWGYDPNKYNEEHHSGLAADFMLYNKSVPGGIDTEAGNWIAAHCIENAKRLGVRWVIFRQRIWNPLKGGWRDMADRGNPTANHMDHVHVLFADTPYVMPGKVPVFTPAPVADKPASSVPPALQKRPKLKEDGDLGEATIREWQRINGTYVDGVISVPSSLVTAVQLFLNRKGMRGLDGRKLVVDGRGIASNHSRRVGPTNTIAALQRYYGTPVDGVLSEGDSALVRALQRAINRQNGY